MNQSNTSYGKESIKSAATKSPISSTVTSVIPLVVKTIMTWIAPTNALSYDRKSKYQSIEK